MLSGCSEDGENISGRFLEKVALSLEGWLGMGMGGGGNSVGKIRRWEPAGTTWGVGGSFIRSGGEMFLSVPHILTRCCHSHPIF